MNETDLKTFMQKDYLMTSSDGRLVIPGNSLTHPRSYGSFPRKLKKYVFDDKVISKELAIDSATVLPAEMFQLKLRGELKSGYIADITLTDLENITDKATFTVGCLIEYLIINGHIVIENGSYNGKQVGSTIRFSTDAYTKNITFHSRLFQDTTFQH